MPATAPPQACDLLIEAGWVVPVEPHGLVLEDHAVAVDAGVIVAVLPRAEARERFQPAQVVSRPGSVLVPVGDVDALSREIIAQVEAGVGRSSSERQGATWVVENFERARLWSGLVDRYHTWAKAS